MQTGLLVVRHAFALFFGSVSTTSLSRRSLLTYRSWFSATSERFHVIYSLIPTAHTSSFLNGPVSQGSQDLIRQRCCLNSTCLLCFMSFFCLYRIYLTCPPTFHNPFAAFLHLGDNPPLSFFAISMYSLSPHFHHIGCNTAVIHCLFDNCLGRKGLLLMFEQSIW